MSTLLLTLSGPLQSWGSNSKYDRRGTEREPTKSGVLGLLACALGMKREDDLSRLRPLRFGVGVVKEGKLLLDYHTVHTKKWWEAYESGEMPDGRYAYQTYRYYLSDAKFIAALESEDKGLLDELAYALDHPVWPIYLGRRSCPPAERVCRGVVDLSLEDALREALGPKGGRILVDAGPDDLNRRTRRDLPESFNQEHRRYGFRFASEKFLPSLEDEPRSGSTDHDAFAELDKEPDA